MAIRKGKITIEKLFGGMINKPVYSSYYHPIGGDNQYLNGENITFCRRYFEGCIAPGYGVTALTDASSYINGTPQAITVASNGEAFSILSTAKLVQFGFEDNTVDTQYTITPHATHTWSSGEDIVSHIDGNGNEYIFYAWNDNVDGDIGRVEIDGTGQDDDYFSTVPTGGAVLATGVPHIMTVGKDGIIYITNGQYIASLDITGTGTPTANPQALDLDPAYTASAITTYGNYIAVIGYKKTTFISSLARGNIRVWLWDGYSPSYNYVYDIDDNYTLNLFNYDGTLWTITNGRNSSTKIRRFNGNTFDVVFEYADNIIGSSIRQNQIDTWGQGFVFGSSNGVFEYNTPDKRIYPMGVHNMIQTTAASPTGFVKELVSGILYYGKSQGIVRINEALGYNNDNAYFYSKSYDLPYKSAIDKIKIYFAGDVSSFTSKSELVVSITTEGNYISFKTDDITIVGKGVSLTDETNPVILQNDFYHEINRTIPDVNSFKLALKFKKKSTSHNYTHFVVRKIEVEYTYDDQL